MWQHFRWIVSDHGAFYGPTSSWVGDLTLLSIPALLYRKHVCHTRWCWRLGKHPDGVYTLCTKHHPET